MRHLLPRLCIEKLYKTFVRLLLDYADVIYDNCSSADSVNIEHVQRRACIISTGAIRITKHVTLLKEVGLELLKTRRKVHRLTYLYKIKNHLVPDYLCNFYPLFHHNTENYNLRRHANLIPIRSRTVAYYNSFLLATIRDWNSLSAELISATSLANSANKPKGYHINNYTSGWKKLSANLVATIDIEQRATWKTEEKLPPDQQSWIPTIPDSGKWIKTNKSYVLNVKHQFACCCTQFYHNVFAFISNVKCW
ncbi:unnamed protein product [Mytilus coruscus]|uniref:Uncharacterized protein n=1 Tax=Mytilus coruscus TaxID=42192 RepID=A0A6J8CK82_MYTCO|nr:unnamed protein product [Mytilus coruscus]